MQLQHELTNFMKQISPNYRRLVTKHTFKQLVEDNFTLKRVCEEQIER